MRQGQIKFKNGNYREAIKEFKQALNYKLEDTVAWVFLSNAYSSLQEYDNMLESMRNIIKYNSKIKDENDMFYALPPIAKNINKIIELCTDAIKNPAEFKGEWLLVGSYFLTKKEYNKAKIAYLEVIKQHPDNPLAKFSLASLYFKIDHLNEALELIDEILDNYPYILHALVLKAKILAKMEDIENAMSLCDSILQEDPLMELAINLKIELQEKKGESTLNDLNPMEIYENVEIRKDQKDFIMELEKENKKPIKPLAWAEMELGATSGFVVRAGYITELNLAYIFSLPPSIRNLKYLKSLIMPHRMDPKGLPDGIDELKNIEYLLYQNSLTLPIISQGAKPKINTLTEKICKLESLKKLNIRDSYGITHLPKCLANLPHLEEINMGNCHLLTHIPDIIKVHFRPVGDDFHLKLIRRPPSFNNPDQGWEGSKFSKTPKNKASVDDEVKIFIDDPRLHPKEAIFLNELWRESYTKHQLKQMEENLKRIPKTQRKRLFRNAGATYIIRDGYVRELIIKSIGPNKKVPLSILNLTMLEKLKINSHQPYSLPENIGNLINLKELELHNVINLPSSISKLRNLEKLIISGKIVSLNFSGLINLRELKIISGGSIIFEGFETLNLLRSLIVYYPNTELLLKVSELASLESLELSYIKSQEVPESIGTLKALKCLKILNSFELKKLPKTLENLTNLHILIINNCSLAHFPFSIRNFPSLHTLSLKDCKLKTLPLGMKYLRNISNIDINNNPIDPKTILNNLNKQVIDKEEAIYQLSYLIKGWNTQYPEYYGQEDFEYKPDNVKKESIKALLHIAQESNIEESLLNDLRNNLNELLCDKDPEIRSFLFMKILEIYPSFIDDTLQILIKNELSHLNLKLIYYYLKDQIEKELLFKKLLIRLSKAFRVIPKEAGGLFEIFSILIIEDHSKLFDEAIYSSYSFDFIQDLEKTDFGYVVDNDKVIGLTLKGFGLHKIPEGIKYFKKLQYLDLQDNYISEIPTWVVEIPNLIYLNLKRNNLSSISLSLSEKEKKIKLNISQNPIRRVSEAIYNSYYEEYMKKAAIHESDAKALSIISYIFGKKLSIYWKEESNYIENRSNYFEINDEGRVVSLILNNLDYSIMTDFPQEIVALEKLERLQISTGYNLANLANNLSELKNLTYLNLKDNNLRSIPEELFKIESLKELILSGNLIEVISDSIRKLENLNNLDLSYNSISELPLAIFEMKNLIKLSLMGNKIKNLSDSIENLNSLKELYLGYNKLNYIPETICSLSSLEILSISYNNLTFLPKKLGNLTKLRILNVSGNLMSYLPSNFCSLTSLENLDLSDNKLELIPDCIASLPALKRFNLSYNEMDAPSPIINSIRGIIFKRKRNPEYDYMFY